MNHFWSDFQNGDYAAVAKMIETKGFDVNCVRKEESSDFTITKSLLYLSIEAHAEDIVQQLLKNRYIDVNKGYAKTKNGATPSSSSNTKSVPQARPGAVHRAVNTGAAKGPTKGTAATKRNGEIITPLFEAVNQKMGKMVSLLLKNKKIDVNIGHQGVTPLQLSIDHHDIPIMETLLRCPTITITKNDWAKVIGSENPEIIETFLAISSFTKNLDEQTTKMQNYAFLECKNTACIQVLKKYFGSSEICTLFLEGKYQQVEQLLEQGSQDVNSHARDFIPNGVKTTSLLYLSIDKDQDDITWLLVDNPSIDINKGETTLVRKNVTVTPPAVAYDGQDKKGQKGTIETKKRGGSVWHPAPYEEMQIVEEIKTPLFLALEKDNKYVIESIVKLPKIDMVTGYHGVSPLQLAIDMKNAEYMKHILKNPAVTTNESDWARAYKTLDRDIIDGFLTFSTYRLDMDIIDQRKAKFILECKDSDCIRVMLRRARFSNEVLSEFVYIALTGSNDALFDALLSHHGIDMNNVKDGKSALYICITECNGDQQKLSKLLKYNGIDVNVGISNRHHEIQTPIFAAVARKQQHSVELLVAQPGIDLSIVCSNESYSNMTAIQLARSNLCNDAIVKALSHKK